jgi:hypothetical protein
MGIYRGVGGTGDSTTDATITEVTQQATDAAASASAASSSASAASSSASSASTQASAAATSATASSDSKDTSAAQASTATTKASEASTSATAAANSATASANSATAAANSATAAAAGNLPTTGGAMTGAITTNSTFDGVDIATRDSVLTSTTTTANAALPKAGGALTGAVTTNSTFDGVDIATRDAILTSTTTTASAALPKAGGALTGAVTTNSTFDGVDIATRDGVLTSTTATAAAALPKAGGTMTGDTAHGDNVKSKFGTGDDLQLYHDGSNSFINDTAGTGNLYITSNQLIVNNAAHNENMARFAEDGAVTLYNNGSAKLATTATGVNVTGTATTDGLTVDGAAVGPIVALTDASSIATNLALSNNYSVTLAGNRTLANPTNTVAGQSGSIFVTQDGTGSRTLAYGTNFKFVAGTAPTLSTAASSVDRIDYVVASATKIHAVASLDVK